MRSRGAPFVGHLALLVAVSCVLRQPDPTRGAPESSRNAGAEPQPYPAASWRFLTWEERDRIVLWVSHILISNRDAYGDPILRPGMWHPDTPPSRSRSEALALASRLADEAGAHPERFEALAMQNSDDDVTRASGGSLGGVRATDLPSSFLDALSTLHPGEVSKLVETGLGYHLLLLRSPPPRREIAARRVVIRYAGTFSDMDLSPSNRTREEARVLANQVVAQARSGSRPFEALVAEFSESVDRALGGSVGVWSTLAPGYKPREVEALGRLKIGEVSPPVDTLWGFQVLQRIEPSTRPHYAMTAVRLEFGADARGEETSRQSVRDKAYALARALRHTPSAFADTQRQNGGGEPEQWDWGHGPPQLAEALDRLHFGEIAPEPIEIPFCFVILMRLDPQLVTHEEPPAPHALPTRTEPDVERLFHDGNPAQLLGGVAKFAQPELPTALHLGDSEKTAFRTSLESFEKDLRAATTADGRAESYRRATERLHDTLSEASYSRVIDLVEREAARLALANP